MFFFVFNKKEQKQHCFNCQSSQMPFKWLHCIKKADAITAVLLVFTYQPLNQTNKEKCKE